MWKSNQYASITPNLYSFPGKFAHIWSNWNPNFVVFLLNCDLIGIYPWNLIIPIYFLFGYYLFKCQDKNLPILMIKQCSGECWIIVWKLFRNVKIEHEWALYTHTICFSFWFINIKNCYYTFWTKSLVIVLKEFKCMCCHTSSFTHDHHGLKYMNILVNL